MEQIALKWNDFEDNVKSAFKDFRDVLNDVTLYCGGKKVCANRLVLCACSQVFRTMLLHPDLATQTQSSILLWDTSMDQLNLILDFMYFGEIKVSESGLNSFLQLAERLRVKGLCGMGSGGETHHHSDNSNQADDTFRSHEDSPAPHTLSSKLDWASGKKPRLDLGFKNVKATGSKATSKLPSQQSAATPPSLIGASPGNNGSGLGAEEVFDIKQELIPVIDEEGEEDIVMDDGFPTTGYARPDDGTFGYDSYGGFEYSDDAPQGRSSAAGRHQSTKNNSGDGVAGCRFQCPLCLKRYKTAGSLQNHRSLYHRNEIGKQPKSLTVVGHSESIEEWQLKQ